MTPWALAHRDKPAMRLAMWIGLGLLCALVAGYVALQIVIDRDGAAVVDAIDRLTAGSKTGEIVEQARYGADPAQRLTVFRMKGADKDLPVMVFIHGGSWARGKPESYAFVGRNFAERGFLTIVAGYRLYPDVRYPAMLEDAAAAAAWARRNAARLGGNPDQIWLSGHSAGAYNAVSIVLDPQWLAAEDVPQGAIAGAIGLSGPYDFYPFDKESTRNSFGSYSDPEATQPINHVRPDAPPLLLLTGTRDTTVRPRNTVALAKAMAAIGGRVESEIYPGMDHSGTLVALAHPWRSRRAVLAQIMQFIEDHRPDDRPSSLAVQAKSR